MVKFADHYTGTFTSGGTIDWLAVMCHRLDTDDPTVYSLGTHVRYETGKVCNGIGISRFPNPVSKWAYRQEVRIHNLEIRTITRCARWRL